MSPIAHNPVFLPEGRVSFEDFLLTPKKLVEVGPEYKKKSEMNCIIKGNGLYRVRIPTLPRYSLSFNFSAAKAYKFQLRFFIVILLFKSFGLLTCL